MDQSVYKLILSNAPFGYAYYKTIFNNYGLPIDYEFIEVNNTFEILTGLYSKDIIGKTVCQIIPEIKKSKFDFTQYYDEVALNSGEKEFEQIFEPFNRCFKVQVTSYQKGYITTIFTDITPHYNLAKVSQIFHTYTYKTIDYKFILNFACEIIGAKYGSLKLLNFASSEFYPVACTGVSVSEFKDKNHLFPFSKEWELETLQSVDFKEIFKINSKLVNVLKIECQGQILGYFTFFYDFKKKFDNCPLIVTFSEIIAMLLIRIKLEIDANAESESFLQITNQINDLVWRTDLNWNNIYISGSVERVLGFKVDEYLKLPINKRYPLHAQILFQNVLQEELNREQDDKFRSKTIEVEHYKADGSIVLLEVNGSLVYDNDGNPIGIQGVSRDVTARKLSDIEIYKLMQVVEQSPLAVLITNIDGLIEYVNPRFVDLTGYSKNEVLGLNPSLLKSGYHPNEVYTDLWNTIKDGKVWKGELLNRKKNGEFFWEATSISSIKNKQGVISHFIAVKENISDKKMLEDDIKHQHNLRNLIMDIATGFINLKIEYLDDAINIALEKLGKFVEADRSYVFEYKWDKGLCNNTHEWCEDGVLAEIDNLQNLPLSVMEEWVIAHKKGESKYISDVSLLPDGPSKETLVAQKIKSFITVPMKDDGNCIGFVGFDSVKKNHNYSYTEQQLLHVFAKVLANVKIRREMNESLERSLKLIEESERKLNQAHNIAKLAGWEYNIKKDQFIFNDNFYKIFHTDVNKIGSYELSPEQYANLFLYPEDVNIVAQEIDRAMKSSDSDSEFYLEHRIRFYDGGTGYIAVKYYIVKDENGQTIKCFGVNQDITYRKLLEFDLIVAKEKAEESDRLKTAFINNISHEIRTPLNGILGFGELMLDENLNNDEKREYYNVLKQSSNRLIDTVTQIMNVSEITAKVIIPQRSKVNINRLINNLVVKFQNESNLKMNQLIANESSYFGDYIADFDEEILYKIYSELIKNSMKFTQNGLIKIGYRVENKVVRYYVQDTGRGISEENLRSVFEPFFQEDVTISRGYEGCGLGLSIVKGLVELLNGRIWVESTKGIGSIFYFEFPRTDD